MPGTNFSSAVPALVNCAVPIIWMSSQYGAVASQKFTCPAVNAEEPDSTVAVKVTTLPELTEVTGAPAEVKASVVVVAAGSDLIVTVKDTVSVRAPEVPVMVAFALPSVAELLTVSVSTLIPVEGF